MASQAELVLRLGRDMAMRVLESSAAILGRKSNAAVAVGGIMSAALVDARALIGSAFLDTMRSQCHGLTLSLGQQGSLHRHPLYEDPPIHLTEHLETYVPKSTVP